MKWSDYSSLESAGKVAFSADKETIKEAVAEVAEVRDDDGIITTHARPAKAKEEREFVVLTQKRWDGQTGEALADSKREYSLSVLESEKARFDSDIARAKAQSDGLAAAIVDFKKV